MHIFDSSPSSNVGLRTVNFVSLKRGKEGDKSDPLRDVYQYWSRSGSFLAEFDPINYPGYEEYTQPNHPVTETRKPIVTSPEGYFSCAQ